MDKVVIQGLEIEGVIGIFDWEREIRQVIRLDIEMATDIDRAAVTDAIEDALDYKAVAKRLIAFVEGSSFGLVETLAARIADILREEFDISWFRLAVSKPGAVRGAESVGVVIERGTNRS